MVQLLVAPHIWSEHGLIGWLSWINRWMFSGLFPYNFGRSSDYHPGTTELSIEFNLSHFMGYFLKEG